MSSVWAPVAAALGASAITGLLGLGTIWWQRRDASRAADAQTRNAAYQALLVHAFTFTQLAQALRQTVRARSGLGEGLNITLGFRRPLDPLDLYDRLVNAFEPLIDAWVTLQIWAPPETVDRVDELVQACGSVLGLAGSIGTARGKAGTALRGVEWTEEEQAALRTAVDVVMNKRRALQDHVRREIGQVPMNSRQQESTPETATLGE